MTAVYSFFSLNGTMLSVILFTRAGEFLIQRDGGEFNITLMAAPVSYVLGWLLSILFMMHCRKNNEPVVA
jgi:hypothetical protein